MHVYTFLNNFHLLTLLHCFCLSKRKHYSTGAMQLMKHQRLSTPLSNADNHVSTSLMVESDSPLLNADTRIGISQAHPRDLLLGNTDIHVGISQTPYINFGMRNADTLVGVSHYSDIQSAYSELRLRGGGPAGDEEEMDITAFIAWLESNPNGAAVLQTLASVQNHPAALELLLQNFSNSVAATRQQLEAMQQNRLRPFHPSIEGVIDGKLVFTKDLTLHRLPRSGNLPVHMDADSLYWISTDPKELIGLLTVPGKSVFNFQSLTNRLDANTSSRFSITGGDAVIRQRVREKKPPQVNMEKYPNVKLAYIDSGKPGVGSYLHLYYCGLEYIPKTPYFTDVMLGLVNVALNLARKAVPTGDENETFSCFSDVFDPETSTNAEISRALLTYNSLVQLLPAFESPLTEGELGSTSKRKNRKTSLKGIYGCLFLELFFEVIESIATDCPGFTVNDGIWDHHFHGMGRDKEILPSSMVQFAKDLNNNMIVTAQSVGLKNHFQGQHVFQARIGHWNDNYQTAQNHLSLLAASLKTVFNLPENVNESISPNLRTRFFADFATNIFPQNDSYYLVPYEPELEPWFECVLSKTHSTERGETNVTTPPSEFTQEEIDAILDSFEDSIEDEEDMINILREYEPNPSRSYAMVASRGRLSNIASGKIVLVISRLQSGKLGQIRNPRSGMCISGAQGYSPWTRQFFRSDVRDANSLLNSFPTYILDLLSGSAEAMGEDATTVSKRCMGILEMIEDSLYHALEQTHSHGQSHVRFECYFDLTKNRKPEWPNADFLMPLRTLRHSHLKKYLKELSGRSLPPLRMFLQTEMERTANAPTNLAAIPAPAKTRIFQCAETAIMLCNVPRYKPVTMKDVTANDGVLEVPEAGRVDLSNEVKSWTGLGYGIDPKLLPFRNTSYPETAHMSSRQITSPLSRILAARLSNQVVIPLSFIDSWAQVKRCFLEYEARANGHDFADDEPLPDFALLADIQFDVIRTSLSDEDRSNLMRDLSHILINLYEREWHYYLFTAKKRKATAREIYWPRTTNRLEDLPTTVQGVHAFHALEPRAVHIDVPRSNRPITTEGTSSQLFFLLLRDLFKLTMQNTDMHVGRSHINFVIIQHHGNTHLSKETTFYIKIWSNRECETPTSVSAFRKPTLPLFCTMMAHMC